MDRFLAARSSRARMREEWGVGDEQVVLGAVARFVPFKNHGYMLDLLLRDRQSGGDLKLLLVGEGELETPLRSRVDELGLQDRVVFLGRRDDIPEVLAGLDALIMTSFYEGLPVALIEAQASGTPAFVSDTITREADLALGLVNYLSLSEPDVWLGALREVRDPMVTEEQVRLCLAERGYDSQHAGRLLAEIYGAAR